MKIEKEDYIILSPRDTQSIVSEQIFYRESQIIDHEQSFVFVIMFLLVGTVIFLSLLTIWNQFRGRNNRKVLTLIDCSTNRTLVYDEHIFSKEIDIFAYGSTGVIREHWRFPLKYKKSIERITQENNCKLISSEEYHKTNDRSATTSEDVVTQEEIFSIFLTSGEGFEHNMNEVKTDRDYIKNEIMTFQVDHFMIEDVDGISSYKTCYVEAMILEEV